MARTVETLIKSQLAQGATLLRTQRVDLCAQIAEALSDAEEAIAARGHHVVTSDSTEPLWVNADPARLRQVLSHLLDNAIKFTEPGGRIEISASRVDRNIVFCVSDTGRGLQAHELASIFELFSQVRPEEGGGLGVGLNVVWQIVALHRGRIEVRSNGPSRGSEFRVILPMAAGADVARVALASLSDQGDRHAEEATS